jgi:hypothetical protein
VFLGVLIFLFVLLEVFSSWRFGVAVRKEVLHRGVAATLRLMGHEIWQQQSQYEPNPYSLYWNKPNSWVDGIRVTCSKGYRWHGREISEQSPDYRILILGGSTTFSNYCFQDYKESWSYKLELLLKSEFPESHIEVVNAGLNYGMTTELLSHFTFKGQFLNPDLVILHGPGNDSLPAALGDYSTDYSKTRDFVYHTVRPLERELLAKSGLLRCLYAIWLHSPHYAKLEPLVFPDNEIQAKNLNNCQGEAFINNLNSLISLCLAKKVTFAYLPFTYAPISRMKNFHGALSQAIYDFEERLSTKANDLIHTYNSRNVCFFDYDKSDFTEECFYDSCHLLSEGERRKSEIVAKKVINLLKVQ